MGRLRLFTDGSVNPQLKIGYGACLLVRVDETSLDLLEENVKVKRFEQTSSTRLELETLLWALSELSTSEQKITIYTDSQNIIGLHGRRERFEQNDYRTKKKRVIDNHELYKAFYEITDQIDCEFVKVQGHKRSHQKDETDRLFTLVDRASREALREHISEHCAY